MRFNAENPPNVDACQTEQKQHVFLQVIIYIQGKKIPKRLWFNGSPGSKGDPLTVGTNRVVGLVSLGLIKYAGGWRSM